MQNFGHTHFESHFREFLGAQKLQPDWTTRSSSKLHSFKVETELFLKKGEK